MTTDLTRRDDDDIGLPDIMMLMMMVMMIAILPTISAQAAQAAQATQATQLLAAQTYAGLTDTRTLRATPVLRWLNLISDPPYHPWVTAYFYNNGPSTAYIAINNPDELSEIAVGEDLSVDMTGADRQVEFVFYKSHPGIEAIVDVTAKY